MLAPQLPKLKDLLDQKAEDADFDARRQLVSWGTTKYVGPRH